MTEYRAIYKCRLCGEEFEEEYKAGTFLTGEFRTDMSGFHDCEKNGDKVGVCDFLGFRKAEDENESSD